MRTAIPAAISTAPAAPFVPPDALYSGRTLAQKLGIAAGERVAVVAAPRAFPAMLGALPAKATLTAAFDAQAIGWCGSCTRPSCGWPLPASPRPSSPRGVAGLAQEGFGREDRSRRQRRARGRAGRRPRRLQGLQRRRHLVGPGVQAADALTYCPEALSALSWSMYQLIRAAASPCRSSPLTSSRIVPPAST